ncbi:MAG TPA: cytochrome c [Candidatus Acidoferrum sp.]|nr:cytochrome c [Candidatus Acidoferrum sp.]
MRHTIVFSALLFLVGVSSAQDKQEQSVEKKATTKAAAVPSGKQLFTQYCAACHGATGIGDGPVAPVLKTRPADLTTLAKRHDGAFPYKYVEDVLRFGPGPAAHGSSDMPTWGPIFQWLDGKQKSTVDQRIKNLSKYLASLQAK